MTQIFGWLSTLSSLSYKIPQIIQLYQSRETSGLNLKSLYIQECSYIFLIIHSISLEDSLRSIQPNSYRQESRRSVIDI